MAVNDLRDLRDVSALDVDLCIVGAGPAGLTLALHFLGTSTRVCVVESGGLEPEPEVEALGAIESVGVRRAPVDCVRARGLGGTSALWTGRCGVFDAIDYQARPWVPHSGWPIGPPALAPYFDRAGMLLGLGPAAYSERVVELFSGGAEDEPAWDASRVLPVVWQYSRAHERGGEALAPRQVGSVTEGAEHLGALQHAGAPRARHFGEAYLPLLRASANVRVLLHAHATSVETDANGARVRGVEVATLGGARARIRASRVVLACGAIDNARLLLASRSVNPRGVGNDHDVVGRFLMDHPYAALATYRGPGSTALRRRLGHRWVDRRGRRHVYHLGLRMSPELQRERGLLNCAIHLLERETEPSAVSAVGRVLRSLRRGEISRALAGELLGALGQPVELAAGAYDRYRLRRPTLAIPGVVEVGCVVEQLPDRSSRVTLASTRDALGMPHAKVDWRVADREYETAKAMAEVMTAELARLGYERPIPEPWLDEGPEAYRAGVHDMAHPLCTTRMSSDPRAGVVDANCEVHGVAGLYAAGGSVFGTSGHMNPTLMIVSLALRLADHLEATMPCTRAAPDFTVESEPLPPCGRARVGLVGAGHRIEHVYLPVFEALRDTIELVGVTARTEARRNVLGRELGIASYASAAELVRSARPDFLVVAIADAAIDAELERLLDLEVPLLVETPFCWNVSAGRRALRRIRDEARVVGVAEQTPFLPIEQMKRHLVELGLVGRVIAVHNDFAHYDYHGIAGLRAYLGKGRTPSRVNASRSPMGEGGEATLATVRYDDGATLVHHYGGGYVDAAHRAPGSLRIYGTSGAIVDDVLRVGGPDPDTGGGPAEAIPIERVTEDGRLLALVAKTPAGEVRFPNPFRAHPLTDEQIAVATLVDGMRRAVHHHGLPAYGAADALEDMELLAAMRFSCARDGSPVSMPLRFELERLRAVDPRALVERALREALTEADVRGPR